MQDSPLFGNVYLGYTLIVAKEGAIQGVRLTLLPRASRTRIDTTELLSLLGSTFVPRGAYAAGAPLSVLLNIASESALDNLMGLEIPPDFGLELPAFLISKPVRAVRLPGLVARGVSVVAKGRTVSGLPEPLLRGCRALIADVADEDLGIHRPISRGARPLDTYIEGLRTVAEAEQALASGACAVLGWPAEEAVVPRQARVGSELRRLIELMRFADRRDPISSMDQLLQAVPEAASRFARLINSDAFGLRVELPSFTHASLLLGHARLMPWLALLLVTSVAEPAARPLAQLALRRGLVMSHWAGARGGETLRDEMFLCGVLSLLDRMTGLPFKNLVDLLPLSQPVQASLQGADGPYVQHLGLVAALERCSFAEVDELAEGLKLSAADVNRALWAALASGSLLKPSEL